MSYTPYIIAAYISVLAGTAMMLAWSYAGMKRAEKKVEAMKRNKAERSA